MTPAKTAITSRRNLLRWTACGAGILLSHAAAAQTGRPFRLGIEGRIDGVQAPFLLALDKGYFREEGLLVTIESTASSRETLTRLAAGTLDLGLCDTHAMIRFRDETPAPDLKAVMIVQDRASFAIVGRRSRGLSQDVKSLEGKKIGAPPMDNAVAAWPIFRALHQLDASAVTLETIGLPVREPMLASGEIDGAFGSAASLYINLKARNVPIDDIVVLSMAEHGLSLYGSALVAAGAVRLQNGEAVASFGRGFLRGLRDCVADPLAAANYVIRANESLRRETEAERLQLALKEEVLTPWVEAQGFGNVDPLRVATGLAQMALAQPFRTKMSAGDVFDDQFLGLIGDRKL